MNDLNEKKILDAMMKIYHMNLLFLSEFDEKLFLRVHALSEQINSGNYKERYFLEYLESKNEFDIYDDFNKKFIFNKKPKNFIKKSLEEVKLDTSNCILNLASDLFYFEDNLEINNKDNIYLKSTKKLINDYNKIRGDIKINPNKKDLNLKQIDKFIFVGTLTGRHIIKILEKFNDIKTIFICEDNLEIFRLSLFVCDYSNFVSKNTNVFFSIMDEESEFINHLQNFFNNDIYNNSIIKYYSTNYNVSKYFDRIVDQILNRSPSSFNYYMTIDNVVKSLSENFFKYKTLMLQNVELLKSFENSKILYIGAGPSLSENIDWINKNQEKFIIVTMASCIDTLIKYDIQADVIITLDPQEHVSQQFFKNEKAKEYLKKSIVLCSHNTNPKVLDKLNQITNMYIYQVLGCCLGNQKIIQGKSVGEVAFSILNIFENIKEVYLIGIDLALNQVTGNTHYSNYDFSSTKKLEDKFNPNFSYRDDVIKIKGNLKETVLTTRLFYTSLMYYNFEMKKINFNVYNLSNTGAFIDYSEPLELNKLNLKDFKKIDKIMLNKYLSEDLDNLSIKMINEVNLNTIEEHLILADKLIESLETHRGNILNYEEFIVLSENLLNEISNNDLVVTYLKEIYLNFTFTFNNYISYCEKVEEFSDQKKILEMINKWIEVLIGVIENYIKYMTKFIVK